MSRVARSKSTPKILLVEDNEDDVLFFRLAISKGEAAEVTNVATLDAAAEHLSKNPLPDLVVMDLKLPGMSSSAFLDWARTNQKLQNIPVVIFTGAMMVPSELEATVRGTFFKSSDLRETVTTVRKIVSLAAN